MDDINAGYERLAELQVPTFILFVSLNFNVPWCYPLLTSCK
jgi:hypothetical protein